MSVTNEAFQAAMDAKRSEINRLREALAMIADAQFHEADAVRGLKWCQDLAASFLQPSN